MSNSFLPGNSFLFYFFSTFVNFCLFLTDLCENKREISFSSSVLPFVFLMGPGGCNHFPRRKVSFFFCLEILEIFLYLAESAKIFFLAFSISLRENNSSNGA